MKLLKLISRKRKQDRTGYDLVVGGLSYRTTRNSVRKKVMVQLRLTSVSYVNMHGRFDSRNKRSWVEPVQHLTRFVVILCAINRMYL
jgi:hypothetical protein